MQKSNFTYTYKLIIERLKAARAKSGLTQIDVATKLGTTQSFVSKIENGERRLDVVEMLKFADLYKLDTNKLLKDITKPQSSQAD